MSAGTVERVTVIVNALTKRFKKGMDQAQTAVHNMSRGMHEAGAVMKQQMEPWQQMNRAVRMTETEFGKFTKNMPTMDLNNFGLSLRKNGKFLDHTTGGLIDAAQAGQKMTRSIKTGGGKVANGFRKMTHGMKGFRMEALGVMFFGMMLQQTFMGLLQPVMQAFGVFDLFRVMLLVLFLPIMEMLYPLFLGIMTWFMDLPGPAKIIIGIFTVLGAILGFLLFVIGSVVLGLGSLIIFGPVVASFLGGVVTAVTGILAPLLIVAAIIGLIIYGISVAFKENFGGIRDWLALVWSGVVDIFKGAFDFIMGIVDIFVALFKGDFQGVLDGVKRATDGFWKFVKGIFKVIFGTVGVIIIGIARLIWGIIKTVFQGGVSIGEVLRKLFPRLSAKLKAWGEGFKAFWGSIWDKIKSKFKIWGEGFKAFWKAIWDKIKSKFVTIMSSLKTKFAIKLEELKTKLKGLFTTLKSKLKTWGGDLITNMVSGISSMASKVKTAILGLFPKWAQDLIWSVGKFVISIFKKDEDSSSSIGNTESADDFVWRKGGPLVKINPNDNLVGFKGSAPDSGGGGGSSNITNNFYGFTKDDLNRELDDRDRRLVNDIARLVKQ